MAVPRLGRLRNSEKQLSQTWEDWKTAKNSFPKLGKNEKHCRQVFPPLGNRKMLKITRRSWAKCRKHKKERFACKRWTENDKNSPSLVYETEKKLKSAFPHGENQNQRKSMIYFRIWTVFLENRQFTIVFEQSFLKIDDLFPYLNSFSWKLMIYSRIWTDFHEKQREDHFFTQKRVLKWSFLIWGCFGL